MEFLQKYQNHLSYFLIVTVTIVMLRLMTTFFYKKLVARTEKKFPSESADSLLLVKRILNSLWVILGIIALSFLWASEDRYAALIKDFKLVIYLGIVAVITIIAASTINMWFQYLIRKKQDQKSDPTNLKFLRYVAVASAYFVGMLLAIMAFPAFKGIAQTALGGAGVIALVAGIASQEALANVVSGIFIIAFKPFKVGDIVTIEGTMEGTVMDITLRHTVIRNFDNNMIVIPNAIINKEKLVNANMGESKCCERLEIGISYNSDIDLAKKIMREECENHSLLLDNRTQQERKKKVPLVKTAVIRLNDSSVTIRAWAWVRNYSDVFQLRWDVYESVKKRFDQEGIEIPFPYRTVVVRQAEGFKIKMTDS